MPPLPPSKIRCITTKGTTALLASLALHTLALLFALHIQKTTLWGAYAVPHIQQTRPQEAYAAIHVLRMEEAPHLAWVDNIPVPNEIPMQQEATPPVVAAPSASKKYKNYPAKTVLKEEMSTQGLPSSETHAHETPADDSPKAFVGGLPKKWAPSQLSFPVEVEARRGQTTWGEAPSKPTDAKALQRRVEGWVYEELGKNRVATGNVPEHWAKLRSEMHQVADSVQPQITPETGNALKKTFASWYKSWLEDAAHYGATGTTQGQPLIPIPMNESRAEREARLGNAAANRLKESQIQARSFREFGKGQFGTEVMAVVELELADNGTLKALRVLRSSGLPLFDAWVREVVDASFKNLVLAIEDSSHKHSIWEFRGRISFTRSFKNTNVAKDAWYLLAMLPTGGLLSGNFDLLSGEASYVDLRHPRYKATIHLIRTYE